MRPTLACFFAAITITVSIHAQDANGPNLDVAGIKIGMGAHEAMAALKAENPSFRIDLNPHQLEGFPQPLHPFVNGEQLIGQTNDGESISLLFTMPPNHEAVWGIDRECHYRAGHRPLTDTVLAALRAKYGQENIPASNPRTQILTWVFDEKGKLLSPVDAKKLNNSCATQLQNHFGNSDISSLNDIQTGKYGAPECSSIILITASVQSTDAAPGNPNLVVYNLSVEINHGPMYRAAIAATREVAMAAATARQQKQTEDAAKVAAPKL